MAEKKSLAVFERFVNGLPDATFDWLKQPSSVDEIKGISKLINRNFALMLTRKAPEAPSALELSACVAGWKAMRLILENACPHEKELRYGFCSICWAKLGIVNEDRFRGDVVQTIRDDLKSYILSRSMPKNTKDTKLNFLTFTLGKLLMTDVI